MGKAREDGGMAEKVTIKDIALRCGTTAKTVSKALNTKEDVSAELANKIMSAAEEMGYIPNTIAKGLRDGQSKIIGIVIDNLLNPYYMIIIHLLDQSLSVRGYDYMIFDAKHYCLNADVVRRVVSRGVDGIISFLEPSEEAVTLFKRQRIPLVIAGRKCTRLDVDCVYSDDVKGGYIAAQRLIADGQKDILVISGPREIECANRRVEGCRRAITEAGLEVREEYFRYIELKWDNGIGVLMDKVFEEGLRFSSVFCFNDIYAQSLMLVLGQHRIRVPQECEIVAYDEINTHLMLPNRLTSVAYDKCRLADEVTNILIRRIEVRDKEPAADVMLDTYLSMGNTTTG
jgi:LacI family transcriptional regulator